MSNLIFKFVSFPANRHRRTRPPFGPSVRHRGQGRLERSEDRRRQVRGHQHQWKLLPKQAQVPRRKFFKPLIVAFIENLLWYISCRGYFQIITNLIGLPSPDTHSLKVRPQITTFE